MAVGRGFKIADGYLQVDADTDKADRKMDRFFRDVNGRLHDERGRFIKEGDEAGGQYGRHLAKGTEKESDRGFKGLAKRWAKRFGSIGKSLGMALVNPMVGAITAGLGAVPSAITVTASAISSALNIGGAAAALAPAAIGGLLLTVGTLKTAFSGLGAALKAGLAGDMAKFAEATKNMAPAMQQAVKALVALNPLMKDLKRTVQQNFWAPFVSQIRPIATTYLPMIYGAMAQISKAFGTAASQILTFLGSATTVAGMGLAFRSISQAVAGIAAGLPYVVQALLTVFQVGATFLPGLTSGFAGLARTFSEFVQAAAADGSLRAWISNGLSMVGALMRGLGDLVGIFRSIGKAAQTVTGSGLLGGFGQLLDTVNRFFQTMQGQSVLTGFFAKLQALGTLVLNLVSSALPGLLTLSDGLVTGLGFLAPIATTVGTAIGSVATAIAPILPTLGKLLGVVLTLAGGVLQALAAELGPLIALWAQLASGLADELLPVITEMITQGLPIAIELGKALADAFAPLVPVILEIAKAVGEQLMKQLPQFLDISRQLVPIIADAAKQLGGALLDAFTRLAPYIPALVTAFLILLRIFMLVFAVVDGTLIRALVFLVSIMITVGSAVAAFVLQVYKLPGIIASAAAAVWSFITGAASAFYGWIVNVVGWLQQLPGKILAALVALPGIMLNFISGALEKVAFAVGFAVGSIIKWFMDLPAKVSFAIHDLPRLIGDAFTSAWNWAKNITSSAISAVVSFASSLPGRARSAISGLVSAIGGVITSAWNGAKTGVSNGISAVVNLAKQLPGRIKGALSGAASWLFGVGQDVVRGLGNGITSMLGWVRDKAKDIANSAISGAKKALGIGSPSKVFRDEVGAWIPPGIQAGVEAKLPALEGYMADAMQGLSKQSSITVAAPAVTMAPVMSPVFLVDGEEIATKIATPERIARVGAEGNRRRNWTNTGRTLATVGT